MNGKPTISQTRRTFTSLLLGLSLALLATWIFAGLGNSTLQAQEAETATADVIVQFDASATVVREIDFNAPISGLSALLATSLDIVYSVSPQGANVCAIEGVGCPADDCFCQCQDIDNCKFWNYLYWTDAGWQSYSVGQSGSVISVTGAIEGYRWGEFGAPMTPVTPTLAGAAGAAWLATTQASDGGFGGPSDATETQIALGANAHRSQQVRPTPGGASLLSYLMLNSADYTDAAAVSPAAAGKLAVGAAAADMCWPRDVVTPSDYYSPTLGAYSVHPGVNAWAMLGALAYGDAVPPAAVATVRDSIGADGGWEWMTGFGSDSNTTALAIQAMVAGGVEISATEVISGLIFLQRAQNADGGFTYDPASEFGTESDANSTAYAIQALLAAGEDPTDPSWITADGQTPVSYLLGLQQENGAFAWQPGLEGDAFATRQVIPALLGHTYPLARGVERCEAVYLPAIRED